jgi:hypothetical protein
MKETDGMSNAISDWELAALDQDGLPCNGVSEESPAGVTVDIVQNWMQCLDTRGWRDGCLHPSPVVLVTTAPADLVYLDTVVRCDTLLYHAAPERSFAFATWHVRSEQVRGLIGLVVPGRRTPTSYRGIEQDQVDELADLLDEWSRRSEIPEQLARLKKSLDKLLRFNQGDAFFARKLGHALPVTPVGKADWPLLYQSERLAKDQAKEPTNGEQHGAGTAGTNLAAVSETLRPVQPGSSERPEGTSRD